MRLRTCASIGMTPYRSAFSHGQYSATAKFGHCEVLSSDDPDELLRRIRRHYHRARAVEKSDT